MALCHSVTGQCSIERDGWIELAVGHYSITLVCYGFDIRLVSAVDKILTDSASRGSSFATLLVCLIHVVVIFCPCCDPYLRPFMGWVHRFEPTVKCRGYSIFEAQKYNIT